MGKGFEAGSAGARIASVGRLLVTQWKQLPIMCSLCGFPNEGAAVEFGETVAWCSQCRRVFEVPALRIPGWVTGVLTVLLINLQ